MIKTTKAAMVENGHDYHHGNHGILTKTPTAKEAKHLSLIG
jgi:hypothetical protein